MQEIAQNSSNGHVGDCPSANELAAYVDGVLSPAEARRITDHLASCEECYEIYSDTVRFILASEPQEDSTVVRFPGKAGRPRPLMPAWGQIAAAAAVLFAGGWTLYALLYSSDLSTAQLTASLPNRPEVTGQAWVGPTYRGEGSPVAATVDEASFRMGVQLVNLQMNLRAGDVEGSQDIVARILGLLKDQPLVSDLEDAYKKITFDLVGGAQPRDLLPRAEQLAEQVREAFEEGSLDFGQWVEGGRLAAIANDPSFLRQTANFLRRTIWRQRLGLDEVKLDKDALQSLREIQEVLERDNLGPSDYSQLKQDFNRILEIYYPET
jgi:hypothetical protein